MAEGSNWLSEVHSSVMEKKETDHHGYSRSVTRFPFTFESENGDTETLQEDEDGDLVLVRKESFEISIEHSLETPIEHVGLQVWPGCLLMCDYIITHQDIFRNRTVVELGGGVGLASMVASKIGAKPVCTDIGDDVLALCEQTVLRNECDVHVRELDWFCPGNISKLIGDTDILIASDVVYDNELTDAFFNVVHQFMEASPKVLILTIEQRINFLTDRMCCACPAYEYFQEALVELKERGRKNGVHYQTEQLEVNFAQCIEYERSEFCEIWKISSSKGK
jgi:predicted nicotinamide N-methyase